MKIRVEIRQEGEDEIVICCKERTDQIRRIEAMLENAIVARRVFSLYSAGAEYFVEAEKILFFETYDGKVYAHTADSVLTAEYRMFELEQILPLSFVRVSRSCIANIQLVSYVKRELVGNGELGFCDSAKKSIFFQKLLSNFTRQN